MNSCERVYGCQCTKKHREEDGFAQRRDFKGDSSHPLDQFEKASSWDKGSLTTSWIRPQWCTQTGSIVHRPMLGAWNASVLRLPSSSHSCLLVYVFLPFCSKTIQFGQFLLEGFFLYDTFRNKYTMKPTRLEGRKFLSTTDKILSFLFY